MMESKEISAKRRGISNWALSWIMRNPRPLTRTDPLPNTGPDNAVGHRQPHPAKEKRQRPRRLDHKKDAPPRSPKGAHEAYEVGSRSPRTVHGGDGYGEEAEKGDDEDLG
jgi:hypothetical protein